MLNLTIFRNKASVVIAKNLLFFFLFCFVGFANQVSAQTVSTTTNTPPSCEFKGPETVCPGSTNEYNAKSEYLPSGYTYQWYVSGDGYIVGPDCNKSVKVKAKSSCKTKYTLKLKIKKNGNVKCECSKVVWVKDVTKPEIKCPKDLRVQCEKEVPRADCNLPKAWDNCGGYVKITFEGDKVEWDKYKPCKKIIKRTYKATDKCGNSSYCCQTITVEDKTKPGITCPKDIKVECDKNVPRADCNSVKAWDNCGGYVKITFEGDKVEWYKYKPCKKIIKRTYKATDKCGNSSYCCQTIIVEDKTKPIIECPKDTTVECYKDIPRADCNLPKAWDNCGGYVKVTFEGDKEEVNRLTPVACKKVIIRTYKATDKCGNSSTCCQRITVEDKTAPVITCPAAIEAACLPAPDPGSVKAEDNCGCKVTVVHVEDKQVQDQTSPCQKTVTRTYKATDECGNSSTCDQIIVLKDTEFPDLVLPTPLDGIVIPACGCPYDDTEPKFTDNCTVTVKKIVEGDCASGVITNIWLATDDCGNLASFTQKIIIDPTANVPCSTAVRSTSARSTTPRDKALGTPSQKAAVSAFPNPYSDQLTFRIVPPVSGKAVLEVYNSVGQKLGVVFNGKVTAGVRQTVNYHVPVGQRVLLMYRLTIGDTRTTGLAIPKK